MSSFEEVYPTEALETQRKRWNVLLSAFEKEYGRKAVFVSRSPGRVNIIGEVCDRVLRCIYMTLTSSSESSCTADHGNRD